MRTSIYLARFLTLFLCVVFPLYLALHASAWLPDIRLLLFSLSKRAEGLHVALTSPLAAPPAPISKEAFEAFAEPAEPVRAPQGGTRKKYPSLPDDLVHCINSLEQYTFLAEQVLQRKHARYAKQTPAQKAISNKLGYLAHFEKARKGIEVNARFSAQIAQMAREDYHTGPRALEDQEDAEFGVADLVFGHLSRDWSTQGAKERQAVFPPVLHGLKQHFGGNGRGKKVLVPGSGYDVTANELDYGSILAYNLLANHTSSLHQHTLQPFVTKWTHQANPSSRYSALTVPDHWPNKAVKLVEGDFLDMFPRDGEFDAVVTLFFIDISENVVDFLSNIHRLLKPGGVWINLGPLKWGTHSALQLSAEEVLQLADLLGFDVDHTSRKSIDSLYAEQPDTLLKFTYGECLPFSLWGVRTVADGRVVTQFWSATKRV
ncbi:N2227-domain-containing protein [Melanomma pulvis-pyrius CBS 109.77]|uniref:N2227-domain-containing protein n=1 Tax=Melanomma pulvis-pyrius CBS 109.77 TaxID=1314802 RepID=A0A6A6XKY9_9PLEO|nr:N2227-domain-containing protein [Melanomma pulvis-pyrius CBS 109.77]